MSVLATADLHLSDNPRDKYRLAYVTKLAELAAKRKVSAIYILGDLSQEKDRHNALLVNATVAAINLLASVCAVVLLKGNHDYIIPSVPFYAFTKHLENVTWINEPTVLPLPITGQPRAMFLPHTTDPKADWKGLKLDLYEWIFAHQTFEGASGGPHLELRGAPLSLIPSVSLMISGDVHVPQDYENIIYVGPPYRINFGDEYEPRVLVIEDDGKIKSVKTDAPRKVLLTVNSPAELQRTSLEPTDVVKVRVAVPLEKASQWPSLKAEVEAWAKKAGVELYMVLPVHEQTTLKVSKAAVAASWKKNDKALVTEYAERQGLDAATVKVGMKLLGVA